MSSRVRKTMVLAAGLFLATASLAAPPSPAEIAAAIRQLGDDDYAVREKASTFLRSCGQAAEPALQEALQSKDLEVARRARAILEQFKWGIYPDTPKDIVELVKDYQVSDLKRKRLVLQQLLQKGRPGFTVLRKLAAAEENTASRRDLFRQLSEETILALPAALAGGDLAAGEDLLELTLASETPAAYRNFAAYLLLTGRLDARIPSYRPRAERPGGTLAAEILMYLYRAKGDLQGARWAAEKADKPPLVQEMLLEQGAWKQLAHQQPGAAPATDIDALGLRAAWQRLAGDDPALEQTLNAIRQFPQRRFPEDEDARRSAIALILNDRPREGIDLLIAGKRYAIAFELLCAQYRYQEAFALAERVRKEHSDDLFAIEIQRARALAFLGDKDRARTVLAWVAGQKDAPGVLDAGELIEAEIQLGLKEQALDQAAAALEEIKDPATASGLLGRVFPGKGDQALVWWSVGRHRQPAEKSPAALKRVGELVNGKPAAKDIEGLVEGIHQLALTFRPDEQGKWLTALSEVCRAGGREDLARASLEKAAQVASSAAALTRLGDYLARQKLWAEAAERYRQAWEKDRRDAGPLYLRGWALAQAGQGTEGQKLMDLAHLLPLGDEEARYILADTLARHDLTEAAGREYQLVLRVGQPDAWAVNMARRQCARRAFQAKDFLTAATLDERAMLECLKANTSFVKAVAYLAVPHLIHRQRAQGLLAAGRVDEALRESQLAQAALPGEIELAIALVPGLEQRGRKSKAEALFDRTFQLYTKLCQDYPQSAGCHNALAWLAARCRRHLDQALVHARRAVELAPQEPGYLDTLAEVHFQRGETEQAVSRIRQCIALKPGRDYFRKQLRRFEAGDPSADIPE